MIWKLNNNSKISNVFEKIKKSHNSLKNNYSISLKICYLLLGSLFFPTFIRSILMILNINILVIPYFLGIIFLLISYGLIFYDSKQLKINNKSFYLPLIISFIILIFSFIISFFLYETSWDGYAYHLPAVIKLRNGWNPIYQHFDNKLIISIWSEHYPKFIWIYSSLLYKITNNIFIGSSFNIIFTIATFFMCYDLFRKNNNSFLSIVFSFIISFNAISIGQLFTMYNDGVLGLSIFIIMLIYRFIIKNNYKYLDNINPYLIILSIYLSILVNIKFTGALFAFTIFLIFSLCCLYKKIIKINKKSIIYFLIIGINVFTVATNTYIPNIIYHKNIGYPIIGKNKIDIITNFVPEYAKGSNKIEAFLKSVTATPSTEKYKYNPFYIINIDDIRCSSENDCRKNGFGPFFQIIIILMLIIIFISIINKIKNKKSLNTTRILNKYLADLTILFILTIFFFITPATWWSRYVPYMYFIPLFSLIVLIPKWSKKTIINYCGYLILLLYCITAILLLVFRFENSYFYTIEYKKQISEVKKIYKQKGKLEIISLDDYYNYREIVTDELLKNNKIKYNRSKKSNCNFTHKYNYLNIGLLECNDK